MVFPHPDPDPMPRHLAILPLAFLLATACGDQPADDATPDSTGTAVATEPAPTVPRVMAIDVGRAIDEGGRIMGGGVETFPEADTIYVHLRTEHVSEGTALTVRLLEGDRTLESVDVTSGAPDAGMIGEATATLPAGATLRPGAYRVEVLLDGASQGIREITIAG